MSTHLVHQSAPALRRAALGTALLAVAWVIAPTTVPAEGQLGDLSKKYESGSAGPGTVSTGKGDVGGVSYGTYQLSSTLGRADEFVREFYPGEFKGLKAGTPEFTARWRKLAKDDPKGLHANEHRYIKETHYDVLAGRLARKGLDVNARSHALQDVIWSTAVQHGPNTSIVDAALKPLLKKKEVAKLTDEEVIRAIYAERGRRDAKGELVHFKGNSAAVKKSVARRFVDEQRDALAALKKGRGGKDPDGPGAKGNPAARPHPQKGKRAQKRHQAILKRVKKGGIDLAFLGDSITEGWEFAGGTTWKKRFEPLKAANLGVGGDRTDHVLWRITEGGELKGVRPRVVVLLIGTNNIGTHTPAQIAGGVAAIIEKLQQHHAATRVLLLGVFPRGEKATNPHRKTIRDINARLAKLADGTKVRYLDIGPKFLEKNGNLSRSIMPDFVHLTAKGYRIWADAMQPLLDEMMGAGSKGTP